MFSFPFFHFFSLYSLLMFLLSICHPKQLAGLCLCPGPGLVEPYRVEIVRTVWPRKLRAQTRRILKSPLQFWSRMPLWVKGQENDFNLVRFAVKIFCISIAARDKF